MSHTSRPDARPGAADFDPWGGCLDAGVAARNLVGKSVEEAALLLSENALRYTEDYLWMGPVAFCFYAPATLLHLRSPACDDDPDFALSMISIFRSRVQNDGPAVLAAVPVMREFCAVARDEFDRLGFPAKQRARLPRRVAELESAIASV